MQISTKVIQVTRRTIESNRKDALSYSNTLEFLSEAVNCIEGLIDKLTYYKFETLLYYKIIQILKMRSAALKELQVTLDEKTTTSSVEKLEDVYKKLGEINMTISRLEDRMFKDYIKMMGLNKSAEYKEYNNLVKKDIYDNVEDIRNSKVPFGVQILHMEENQEL